MTEELETLKQVVGKLDEGKFNYYLTGSMAMSFYSIPRMTRDSDIVIQLKGKDVDKFVKLFKDEFFIDENMINDSLRSEMMFNIFHKKNFFKIDFIIKTGAEYEEVKFERIKKLNINGIKVNVISLEDLIISKLYWAKDTESEIQLNDIRTLMKLNFDNKYVNNWIARLDLKKIFQKVKP